MAKIPRDQPLLPSVLDRLIDEHPGERDAPQTETQVFRELKRSLRRDLENLLNTRRRATSWPEDLEELERSLVNYGIPDVTGGGLTMGFSRDEFLRTVETVVEQFEPRLTHVVVTPMQNVEPLDRTLRFRIDAELRADPAPEPIVFDSALQPTTGTVDIRGTRG